MPETEFTPENMSEKSLRYGYWFVTHKILLKRIGIIILVVLDAALVGWSGWGWISVYVLEAKSDEVTALQNGTTMLGADIHAENTAAGLLVANASVFTASGKSDFAAEMKNPNKNFRADFTYHFSIGNQATADKRGFILPGDDKFLIDLGEKISAGGSAALTITEIDWHKVDRHLIPDYAKFSADRLNFGITDAKFVPAGGGSNPFAGMVATPTSTPASGGPTGETTFTLTNNTGFGYKDLSFNILLMSGPELAAVNSTIISDVLPGETRQVELTWYESLPAISDTRVIPEVDIMNDGIYLR
jgi:hypothetical protein